IQLIFKVGCFDVDDMILNTLGGILGYIMYKIVQYTRVRIRRKRRAKAEKSVLY
ncbi:MAG TPA: VanZ family protein, partial [Clostridium sp.]|nr:VanZ family protein [Clostridium sp.]